MDTPAPAINTPNRNTLDTDTPDTHTPDIHMMPSEHDRRRDPRVVMDRPVKIRLTTTGRFYAGRLCDLSPGGAKIELQPLLGPTTLGANDAVDLAIAWDGTRTILAGDQMTIGRVVRFDHPDSDHARPQLAIQFIHRAA